MSAARQYSPENQDVIWDERRRHVRFQSGQKSRCKPVEHPETSAPLARYRLRYFPFWRSLASRPPFRTWHPFDHRNQR
ncbi:MAG: hypothetical protein KatS3mg105_1238 [Gemmatales bacterium]|nr:MAG: hypothetical protein KatS3mg105_1238 [Gemmatales bacterium]